MTITRDDAAASPSKARPGLRRARRASAIFAAGEPAVWLTGGALALCLFMIAGLLGLVARFGFATFWPEPVVRIETTGGGSWMGEVDDTETYRPESSALKVLPAEARALAEERLAESGGASERRMLRIGNFELTGEHYKWISDYETKSEALPEWALVLERTSLGHFYGELRSFEVDGVMRADEPAGAWRRFQESHGLTMERSEELLRLRTEEVGAINAAQENLRLELRRVERTSGKASSTYTELEAQQSNEQASLARAYEEVQKRIAALETENARRSLVLATSDGKESRIPVATVVRAYPANQIDFSDKAGVYLSRWWEFLTGRPRESNSEGGVLPAIVGTVVMTLVMSLLVVPLGVLAALYLREYAKAGPVVSCVRIAVNNLAGVPSIVFGVFGLGFFCYFVGTSIDELFFADTLPNPTLGKGGLMWSALTLALLTLPVVIVATEEALAAVPNSMREGSYACGATKWQTIQRIVLPRALPGIMTGMILAVARGAGEVAPLMLVGAVKSAEDLLVDTTAPFIHAERSFMHLGFHIYDLGFQSQNSSAAKPMVYTTTLLLIGIILVLNVTAVTLRARMRRRYLSTPI